MLGVLLGQRFGNQFRLVMYVQTRTAGTPIHARNSVRHGRPTGWQTSGYEADSISGFFRVGTGIRNELVELLGNLKSRSQSRD